MAATYTDNGTNTPNGVHKEFSYTFPILKNEDLKVAINGSIQATNKYVITTTSNPTKITFNDTSPIAALQVTSGTNAGAPLTGTVVRVYRQTEVGSSDGNEVPTRTFAAGSSIRASDLQANQEQALYGIKELQDKYKGAGDTNWGIAPEVYADGVMEVGRYIDFHHTNASTTDYEPRLHTDGSDADSLYISGSTADQKILTTTDLVDEDNMASNSATKVPSQQSVKAYVDANGGGGGGGATNLSNTANGTKLTIESSSGNNTDLPAVTTSAWGVMTDEDKTKLDGIATSATANAGTITSVTGTSPIASSGGTTPAISISAATTSAAGSMSSADKSKLDGIASSANNYTHPAVNHIPAGGSSDQVLKWSSTGTATWGTDNDTTYNTVSTSAAGLAPTLPSSHGGKFLKADGTWVVPPSGGGGEANVQSDWDQTTSTEDDFIQNKPTIPTNNNQLTNGAGFTTNAGTVTNVTGTSPITVTNGSSTPAISVDLSSYSTTSHSHSYQAPLTFGIANTNAVKIDNASVGSGEYAKFTSSGLESKTTGELKTDLSLAKADVGLGNVENTAVSTWTGSTNIASLGTISAGTWQGTAIASGYVGDLAASKITSGTFDAARIPTLNQNTTGSAATLTTPRAINGVNFDGSAAITVADSTKIPTAGGTFTGAVTFEDAINENVFAITDGNAAIDPDNGTIQTWTLGANRTPTDSLTAGQSVLLMITAGSNTVTWPTMTWAGGSAPTLSTSAKTAIELWKVGSALYGANVGDL